MNKIIVGLLIGALAQYANAADPVTIPVTNNLEGTLNPTVVGYKYSQPILCVKVPSAPNGILQINPGESATLSGSQNPYWYDSDVRLNGCNSHLDPYIGYMGIGTDKVQFSSSADILNRMQLIDAKKGTEASITGKLRYIAIPENLESSSLIPLNTSRKLAYIGINLSGAEFGKTVSANSMPDLSRADQNAGNKPGPDLASMESYIKQGVNTVRMPIRWGYLELLKTGSTINNPVWVWNDAYWDAFIAPTLATLTKAKIHTILDLHSYLHYSTLGSEVAGCYPGVLKCPDGTLVLNPEHYLKVWSTILLKVRANKNIDENYLMFDLVNEPAANKVAGTKIETVSSQEAFDVEVPIAVALQTQNFKGKILLEGASWTGLHSWEDAIEGFDSNAVVFAKSKLIQAGIKFNEYSNNVLINVHQYLDDDFSGTQDVCLKNLDSTGKDGKKFNAAAFAKWLKDQQLKAVVTEFGASKIDKGGFCEPILKEFVQYLTANAVKETDTDGGFVGATLWATGHDWGNYNLLFGPDTYQFKTFIDNTVGK